MDEPRIFFLPLMAHGHLIPMLEMAKLFPSHGIKATIIATPAFSQLVLNAQESGSDIGLNILDFPHPESGLPDHAATLDYLTDELILKYSKALDLMQEPVEKIIQECNNPICLVSDMFFTWTVDSAQKFGIPRCVFHGTGFFALCASEQMSRHKIFQFESSDDSEQFVLPDLPHEVNFMRTELTPFREIENSLFMLLNEVREADRRSYGVFVNSFYDLEPDYADHYRKVFERKAWEIGPLFLSNSIGDEEKSRRGNDPSIDVHECFAWLDSKRPNSVVYVCFGTLARFAPGQLQQIANGIEASGQDFIWVVRKCQNEELLPEGFEGRMEGKGLIIRGWAPQIVILDHPAIGAFVTHCGWNSILEGICCGVPLVTWPMFAEQFFNEKLVTLVLRVGISVGNKKWQGEKIDGVSGEAVATAVWRIMVGEEALGMRNRIKNYKGLARKAIEEGGSSFNNLSALIEELKNFATNKNVLN